MNDLSERKHYIVVLRSGTVHEYGTVLRAGRHVFSSGIDRDVAHGCRMVRESPGFVALMVEDVDETHLGSDEYELKVRQVFSKKYIGAQRDPQRVVARG